MRRFGRFNAVEMVKGYAMPSDEGGVDYGGFHGNQRLAAFAGYDGGPGIPGPVGRPSRGVPAYVTQTIPALGRFRGFGLMMDPPSSMTTQNSPPPAAQPSGLDVMRLRGETVVKNPLPPTVPTATDPIAGVLMCPEGYDAGGGVCRPKGMNTGLKIGLMVGVGVLIAYSLW